MQLLLLAAGAAFGSFPKAGPLLASLAQTVSWSTIVCLGIALVAVVSSFRAEFMGLAGLLSAPLALNVARSLHRGVSAALALPQAPAAAAGPSPLVLGVIKALEYGCFAAVIGWIVGRGKRSALHHVLVGLSAGVVFGGIILGYLYVSSAKRIGAAVLLPRAINEILFPVGCSLVLFATELVGEHYKPASREDAADIHAA